MTQFQIRFFSAFVAAALLTSCAPRAELKSSVETAKPAATPSMDRALAAPGAPLKRYTVKKGDCLWSIAAKPSVLGDAFQWPLLYKQNRDEIADPDLIQPAQRLAYEGHYDSAAIEQALRTARQRPAYRAAKKTLPTYRD